KKAAALWDRVVQLNPLQSYYWYALGDARYEAKDYKAAIPAYQKSADLGGQMTPGGGPLAGTYYPIYNNAFLPPPACEREAAIQALSRALELGFPNLGHPARDPDLVSIRDDPRVIELLGLKDVSRMSRDEGWRYDLAILAREVHRKGFNPQLYVHRPVSREQFDARARELHNAIPRLTDGQIILQLMKLMVFLDDGHTAVWNTGAHPLFRAALPLRLFWFEEGLYVIAADPKYKERLGAQVLQLDERPIGEVFQALEPYVNRDRGNPIKPKLTVPYMIRMVGVL